MKQRALSKNGVTRQIANDLLNNKSFRTYHDEPTQAKIFIEFAALIIRSSMYTHLLEESIKDDEHAYYLNVPASVRELEKIEMVKTLEGRYVIDHVITKTQKAILKAYGADAQWIKDKAEELSIKLSMIKKQTKKTEKEYQD